MSIIGVFGFLSSIFKIVSEGIDFQFAAISECRDPGGRSYGKERHAKSCKFYEILLICILNISRNCGERAINVYHPFYFD